VVRGEMVRRVGTTPFSPREQHYPIASPKEGRREGKRSLPISVRDENRRKSGRERDVLETGGDGNLSEHNSAHGEQALLQCLFYAGGERPGRKQKGRRVPTKVRFPRQGGEKALFELSPGQRRRAKLGGGDVPLI